MRDELFDFDIGSKIVEGPSDAFPYFFAFMHEVEFLVELVIDVVEFLFVYEYLVYYEYQSTFLFGMEVMYAFF